MSEETYREESINAKEIPPVEIAVNTIRAILNFIALLWKNYRLPLIIVTAFSAALIVLVFLVFWSAANSTGNWGKATIIMLISLGLSAWSLVFKKYWAAVWLILAGVFFAAGINWLFNDYSKQLTALWIIVPALAAWKTLLQARLGLTGWGGKTITFVLTAIVVWQFVFVGWTGLLKPNLPGLAEGLKTATETFDSWSGKNLSDPNLFKQKVKYKRVLATLGPNQEATWEIKNPYKIPLAVRNVWGDKGRPWQKLPPGEKILTVKNLSGKKPLSFWVYYECVEGEEPMFLRHNRS